MCSPHAKGGIGNSWFSDQSHVNTLTDNVEMFIKVHNNKDVIRRFYMYCAIKYLIETNLQVTLTYNQQMQLWC